MFIYPKGYLDQLLEESPATTVDGSEIPKANHRLDGAQTL